MNEITNCSRVLEQILGPIPKPSTIHDKFIELKFESKLSATMNCKTHGTVHSIAEKTPECVWNHKNLGTFQVLFRKLKRLKLPNIRR